MENTDMSYENDIKKLNKTLFWAIALTAICIVMIFSNLSIGSRTIVAIYLCLIPVVLVMSGRAFWLDFKLRKVEKARSGEGQG